MPPRPPSGDQSPFAAAAFGQPKDGVPEHRLLDQAQRRPLPPAGVFAAETVIEEVEIVDEQSWPLRLWCRLGSGIEWCFGMVCMLVLLAVLASIPILQFVSLGYLLEVSGRISRSGRLRDCFLWVRTAAHIGSLFAGTWLVLLPLRFVSDLWYSSHLLDASSGTTAAWRVGVILATTLTVLHILMAWYCGGRLRHFFWPLLAPMFLSTWLVRKALCGNRLRPLVRSLFGTISPRLLRDLTRVPSLGDWFPPAILWAAVRQGGMYSRARDAVWQFVVGLQFPYYFWLGLRGFAGAITWLFVPILMMIASIKVALGDYEAAAGLGGLLGLTGSILLAIVILYLPFLQAHFAAEQRFAAMFEWRQVRDQFRRAPIAFWMALLITLLFALPLYLLKVAVVPREVVWLPSLVFVALAFPARVLTGWAVGRARFHQRPRFFLFRWMARLAAIPIALIYASIVYFTQYTSWYGAWSLFEQHAFLTPVPFLGL